MNATTLTLIVMIVGLLTLARAFLKAVFFLAAVVGFWYLYMQTGIIHS